MDNIQKKIVFYIVAITIPLFLISFYLTQNYVEKELKRSSLQKAHIINLKTIKTINNFLSNTSEFTKQASYMIKIDSKNFRKILPFLKKSIKNLPSAFGSALAIDPDSSLKQTYCKYYYKYKNFIREKYLLPPKYNYLNSSWYKDVKKSHKPIWSEPYFDKGGGEVFMTTYSFPIEDLQNEFLGVITVDVKLDMLDKKIQNLTKMSEGFVFVVSKEGLILSHPDKRYSLKKSIYDYAKDTNSKNLLKAYKKMKKNEAGVYNISLNSEGYTLYTMYIPQTSWTVGVVLKDSILFKPLNDLKKRLIFIVFIGILLILVMVVIVSNQLKKSVAKDEKIKNELELASRIQQSFLPKQNSIKKENFCLSGIMKSAKEVGGDFYGYKESDDKLLFYVGDVSGKGVPASLFMMASVMLIEDAMDNSFDPSYIVQRVNNKLCEISSQGMFATLVVGVIDLKTKELTFSTAGHPPFLVKGKSTIYTPIPAFYPPIATYEDLKYENKTIKLQKESTLVVFTDGVNEAENRKKELYGMENLTKELFNIKEKDADIIKEKLLQDIKLFTKGEEQSDDLTMIIIVIK